MKIFTRRTAFVALLLIITSLYILAQRSNGIAIEGKISVQQGTVDGAVIQMFKNGQRLPDYGVGADGRYKLELDYNHKYILIFSMPGNFSQKIVVESEVPKTVLQNDPRFPAFPLNINLFTEIPGIDKSFTDNTIQKIYYNSNVDNFVSELYYNDAQIAKLIEQAVLQSQVIGKEADYLSKLSRAERNEMKKEYDDLIEQASKEYSNEQFLSALDGFKAASKIFPNEQFPKDRIAEINDLLGLIMVAAELDKAKAERFNLLIKEADQLLAQKKYSDAKNSYSRALSIKPNDEYANKQINTVNDLIKNQMEDEQYENLIALADNSFDQLLYNEAAKSYREALDIKPNQSHPQQKLVEIEEILAKEAENAKRKESYEQAMKEGEAMFQKQFYEKALASFENALEMKPGDAVATRKIENVNKLMKDLADKLMYDKLIAAADKSYRREEYEEALKNYNAAESVIPEDRYAVQRIEEITNKIKSAENFAELIARADQEFINKNYSDSKQLYSEALEIVVDDRHSVDRIKEIDALLATLEIDQKYTETVAQADDLFNVSEYENAKIKYNEAAGIKPKEKYPKDKISEIDGILSQIAKTNQDYQKAIDKAENLYNQKSYPEAKAAFAEAGRIKPDETYPSEMTTKIDGLIEEQARLVAEAEAERLRLAELAAAEEAARLAAIQAEKDKNYSEAISNGDRLFNDKDYENARNEYRAALEVKPEETYPQQKIEEIVNIIAAMEKAKQEQEILDKNYLALIQQADQLFATSDYLVSKEKYIQASDLKPEESYPKDRITEIDKILEQQKIDEEYRVIIVAADGFFKTENYTQAKSEYERALTVKSEEQYPKNQINKINQLLEDERLRLLAEQKAAEEYRLKQEELAELNKRIEAQDVANDAELMGIYERYVKQADELFNIKQYIVSRGWYYKALDVKPDEEHPRQRIAEIDRILQSLMTDQKDRDYQNFVDMADSSFRENQYAVARGWYNRALSVKGDEQYPKDQIKEIENKIAERMAGRSGQQFEEDVQKGNMAFESKSYNVARFWYKKALELRPDNAEVKARLIEIEQVLK